MGLDPDIYHIAGGLVDRTLTDSDEAGFAKVLVEKKTDRILGATIVGANAGDIISQVTFAMTAGAGLGTIAKVIYPYPTRSEAIKKAADAYRRTRLTPAVKFVLGDGWHGTDDRQEEDASLFFLINSQSLAVDD